MQIGKDYFPIKIRREINVGRVGGKHSSVNLQKTTNFLITYDAINVIQIIVADADICIWGKKQDGLKCRT